MTAAGAPRLSSAPRTAAGTALGAVVALVALVALVAASVVGGVGAAAGRDPPRAAPRPDLSFYAVHVGPWLDARCGDCHRGDGAGAFRLAPPGADRAADLARRERELATILPLVDPESPWRSRFLRKLVDEEDGGLPHAGGALLRRSDDDFDLLLDFVSGATLKNLPPEPEPGRDRRADVGQEVELDGSASYDRDDDPLVFRWELFARPPGSRAALSADDGPAVALRPDAPGTYVVRLRVFDGKVWSGAKPLVVEALERTGPTTPDAVAASGLASLPAAALRRVRSVYGDVLGRPPTPPEALADARKPAREVAAQLLATLEAGRALVEDAAFALDLVGDFEPLSASVDDLPARLTSGEATPGDVEAALVRDPAFLRAHPPGAALAEVTARLLRVAPSQAVHAAADLPAMLRSHAFAVAAMRRFARRFLAEPDAAAVPEARAGESALALATSFVASPSWAGGREARRGADDLAFVRAAFADLLGRRPTGAETVACVAAARVLAGRPGGGPAGRTLVVAALLESGEVPLPLLVDLPDPAAWLADRFLRTLGRPPTPEEARVHREALLHPAGGPHLVLRALLAHPEYASR